MLPFVVPPIVLIVGLLPFLKNISAGCSYAPRCCHSSTSCLHCRFSIERLMRDFAADRSAYSRRGCGEPRRQDAQNPAAGNPPESPSSHHRWIAAHHRDCDGRVHRGELAWRFNTFSVYTYTVGTSTAYEGVALSFISFIFVWGAMLGAVPLGPGQQQRRQLSRSRTTNRLDGDRRTPGASSHLWRCRRARRFDHSRCVPANLCPCSARAAAGRRRRCESSRGFEWPDSGEVLVEGQDVLGKPANKRNMGMVFQAYSLFPNMTAQQNVEFGLRVRKREPGEAVHKGPGNFSS